MPDSAATVLTSEKTGRRVSRVFAGSRCDREPSSGRCPLTAFRTTAATRGRCVSANRRRSGFGFARRRPLRELRTLEDGSAGEYGTLPFQAPDRRPQRGERRSSACTAMALGHIIRGPQTVPARIGLYVFAAGARCLAVDGAGVSIRDFALVPLARLDGARRQDDRHRGRDP